MKSNNFLKVQTIKYITKKFLNINSEKNRNVGEKEIFKHLSN